MGRGKRLDNKQILFSGNLGGGTYEKETQMRFAKIETAYDKETCSECEGAAVLTNAVNQQPHNCFSCDGRGYFNAVIERNVCKYCKADGSVCFKCFNGIKTIRTIDISCPECKNNLVSKAKCKTCESFDLQTIEKKITCSGCSGSGKDLVDPTLDCMVCSGKKYNLFSDVKQIPGSKKVRATL